MEAAPYYHTVEKYINEIKQKKIYENYFNKVTRNWEPLIGSIVYMIELLRHPSAIGHTDVIYRHIFPLMCIQNILVDDIADMNNDMRAVSILLRCFDIGTEPPVDEDDKLFGHATLCCKLRDEIVASIGKEKYNILKEHLKVEDVHRLSNVNATSEEMLITAAKGMLVHVVHFLETGSLKCLTGEDPITKSVLILARLANDISSFDREKEEIGETNYAIREGIDRAHERFNEELVTLDNPYMAHKCEILLETYCELKDTPDV